MRPEGAFRWLRAWPRISLGRRTAGRSRRAPLALLIPALVITLFMFSPLVYLVMRASDAGTGLFDLLWRDRTLTLIRNTVVLSLSVTAASIVISLPLAWLTARTDLPWRRFWTVVTALPLVIPTYVGAFVVIAAFGPRGMLQSVFEVLFGVQRLPEIYGFFGAFLTLTFLSYPYVLLSLRVAMSGLDPALEEAATSMGYGSWTTFWRITLPQLRPALAAGSLLVALYVLSDFGAISLLQYDAFTRAIYNQYRGAFDRTAAAGLALVLVAMTGIVLGLEAWTRGRARYHRSTAGTVRPTTRIRLGPWKAPAVALCAGVATISLVVPITVISYWLVNGLRAGEPLHLIWGAALNSVLVSLIGAVTALFVAIPIVVLSVRHPGRLSGLIERVSYFGYALPGIVVALSLVFFGARYATPLYQTLAMLVVAYVILFLPQAIGALRASLLQVGPNVEDAARSLGNSTPGVWLRVTGPLVRPGILGGGTLVFLTVMKELPATLLLRPIGYDTLAIRIWSATAEGFWARAAAPALLLILVAAIPMVVVTWRQARDMR